MSISNFKVSISLIWSMKKLMTWAREFGLGPWCLRNTLCGLRIEWC
ncbi:Hypothetical protein DEACI_2990 [Acididesulfobacillus acetoxydans]|uniref:Uncharacterized protein n=1 Tax=Acididesulfobacillus acetoxydans TaxID=1561005 RepID=A0A8S0XCD6_9FIRM|nr:Hypothetical protein DEACI_2990 [Acididesulfobacillus acetoxydans]CEJ08449.1 Hypothetical protein DEACI_2925 [Acididesulfobacillus acetoxydans]